MPGTGNLFALGSAYFDTSQPNIKQAGILTVTPSTSGALSESTRTVLTSSAGLDQAAGSNNGIAGNPSIAVGSRDSYLAIDTGVANGHEHRSSSTPPTA